MILHSILTKFGHTHTHTHTHTHIYIEGLVNVWVGMNLQLETWTRLRNHKILIKNTQEKPLFIPKTTPCYKHKFHSQFFSIFLSLDCLSPFLHVLLSFILPSTFLLKTLSHHRASEILFPLDTFPFLFMMNMDFWGLKHYSGQSFSNKCDCIKQMVQINAEVTITLILWSKRSHKVH